MHAPDSAGFNNDDHISVGSRSLDEQSHYSEGGRSQDRGRPAYRTPLDPEPRYVYIVCR